MKHGSLFSGIGGFDLAAEWMGWVNIFHCEWNEFGQRVLKYYWPNAISYADITKTDFTPHRGAIDILSGGFPCQPYSQAGKRLGKEDERHLWPEMLRAIREIQPRWVVGENVRGLVNWNGGLVFDEVQADLEATGYEVFPFLLPAAGVNAPHERYRIWLVAYAASRRGLQGNRIGESKFTNEAIETPIASDTRCGGLERRSNSEGEIKNTAIRRNFYESCGRFSEIRIATRSKRIFDNFPTQSPVLPGNDGLSARLDGITFSNWRNESIKAGGNAIVPQVVLQIFNAIQAYEDALQP